MTLKTNKINILGVDIDKLDKVQALEKIEQFLASNQSAQIATVNPEFIIEAQENQEFKQALNNTNLNVADGIGIRAAAKLLSYKYSGNTIIRLLQLLFRGLVQIGPSVVFYSRYLNTIPETITGVDLSYDIAHICAKNQYPIFLLGAQQGIAQIAGQKLQEKYPGLIIANTYAGSADKEEEDKIIKMIDNSNAKVILVAYGAPKQDLWIKRNLNGIQKPILAMGVGGTLDFISGYLSLDSKEKVKRAPKWLRKLNLEWLYRLIKQPKRIKRIYTAVVVFPWLVFKFVLKKKPSGQ